MKLLAGYRVRVGEREGTVSERVELDPRYVGKATFADKAIRLDSRGSAGQPVVTGEHGKAYVRVGFDDGLSELRPADDPDVEIIDPSAPLESVRLGSIRDERYAS